VTARSSWQLIDLEDEDFETATSTR